jgi:hypothetical protein
MDLTLASALSQEGLLGHAAYVLLVLSMLMRTLFWLRLLVIASAILGISYSVLILNDPVSAFWETCLVLVNIAQLVLSNWRNLRARFTPEESAFIMRHLPGLSRGEARALLDAGAWYEAETGETMTVEGAPVSHLCYLAEGVATVEVGGVRVASCRDGDFIGEMTAPTGLPATATVRAEATCLVWRIEASKLRQMLQARSRFEREFDAALARNYREKIVQMNVLAVTERALP